MSCRVALVNPPLERERQAGAFKSVANFIAPLGLGYLAAVLRRDHFDVEIVDAPPLGWGNEEVARHLEKSPPGVVGVTATVLSINSAIALARHLRRRLPEARFVIGGPHATTVPKEVLPTGVFGAAVLGEGEETFLEVVRQHAGGTYTPSSIRGLAYLEGDEVVVNEPRPYIDSLDDLPFPARDLYPPLSHYTPLPLGYRRLPFAHMVGSRGCPYHCTFCDQSVFSHRFRGRSATNVVDEMEELSTRFGVRDIRMYDDLFTCRASHVEEVCRQLIQRKLDVTWSCSTRVDSVTSEMMENMRQAGCWEVAFGLETGDPELLASVKKETTIEEAEEAVARAREAGLRVRAFFVLGLPGETVETIRRTVDWAISLRLSLATFYVLALYPGSELYARIRAEGTLRHQDYGHYTSIINPASTRLHYVPEAMTEDELKAEVRRAYHRFYLRAGYVWQCLRGMERWSDLSAYLAAARALLEL